MHTTFYNRLVPTECLFIFFQSLDFPAITVCNFNAVKLSALEYFPDELREDIEAEIPRNGKLKRTLTFHLRWCFRSLPRRRS